MHLNPILLFLLTLAYLTAGALLSRLFRSLGAPVRPAPLTLLWPCVLATLLLVWRNPKDRT